PNMDGFQVIDKIRASGRLKNFRIIVLTNHDEMENEVKGLILGAVDYIRKPIHMESLKLRIDIHIEQLRIIREMENSLREKSVTFDTLFQQAPIGITISYGSKHNENMENALINSTFENITGRSKEDLVRLGWGDITHPDDLRDELPKYQLLLAGKIDGYSMDKRYIKSDGSTVWVHIVVSRLYETNDLEFNHICLIQDISLRKNIELALEESERAKSVLLSHLPGMAYRSDYDPSWTMRFVSGGCEKLTGYKPEDIKDNSKLEFAELITEAYRKPLRDKWAQVIADKGKFEYEYEIITSEGEKKWVLEMGEGVYNENGEVEALEGIILDISQRKKMENSFKYQSEHDEITGLYNLRYLERLLVEELSADNGLKKAVVGINLSSIQSVTKAYGFHYAHDLSRRVAEALRLMAMEGNRILFNAYSTNFIYYLKDYISKDDLIDFCEEISERLSSVLAIERITGGIGIVEIDDYNKEDIEKILRNVLVASEQAINSFEKDFAFRFYTKGLEEKLIREEHIKHRMVRIVEDGGNPEFYLNFQPIIDLRTNRIINFEALARLSCEDCGFVSPLEFIPIAEKTKLIIPLGEIIIIESFRFLEALRRNGFDHIGVSINISVIQLLRKGFVAGVMEIMKHMEIDPGLVTFEITESVFGMNNGDLNEILEELSEIGIRIAIDDFGTGYSSLARERELSVSCLKIDKSFIDKLMILKIEETITSDIVSMAHKLGHYVVAEGVEHKEQVEYLKDCGCDMVQGYFISKPMDGNSAIEFIGKYEG
ncbi:MAG: EAL domain-containing protein, partial [Gudongella sp.]|nr:EAL domain-containing protein [Gudongella sp.]